MYIIYTIAKPKLVTILTGIHCTSMYTVYNISSNCGRVIFSQDYAPVKYLDILGRENRG